MTQPPNVASPMRPRTLVAIALVVALAAVTMLHRLGAADVCGSNEAVEAVFLQQMVEHDALLFPLENGRSPMYKPPLFHWTAVAIDRLAGVTKVTAFNLRLPAALYAIAGVILTIAFASTILSAPGGMLAGLILTASYQYLENARIGRVDMTLCFFETLALFAFARWSVPTDIAGTTAREPRALATDSDADARGPGYLRYLIAVALGLAVLAKGPVGALLPGLAIAIFLVAEGRFSDVRRLATPGPVLLTLALASSWYLACLFGRRYGFLDRQISSENFGRFFGSLGAMAPWYYLKPILLNSAPLSLIVPFAVFAALRTYWRPTAFKRPSGLADAPSQDLDDDLEGDHSFHSEKGPGRSLQSGSSSVRKEPKAAEPNSPARSGGSRPAQNPISLWMALRMMFLPTMDTPDVRSADPDPAGAQSLRALATIRLFAIFWVVTVLFFTVAAYKRRAYLLPLWPASAVTLSWWLTSIAHSRNGRFLRATVAASCAVLIAINFFYLPRREVRECAGDSMREAAAQINRVVGPTEPLYLFQFEDEPAPLLFYLDRTAPRIAGKLGDAPPGYVITTAEAWRRLKPQALDLQPVFESSSGRPRIVLLRHGKAYALR
jgi:4-amino-4-deoxy-L-arabinose transferase-like glycosyltransferase